MSPRSVVLEVPGTCLSTADATIEAVLAASAFDELLCYGNAQKIIKILRKKKCEDDEKVLFFRPCHLDYALMTL